MQGLLIIDKPSGITSFGTVAKIKKLSGIKRVGHTGTLDPMATGVLPVFIGRPTVLCDYLLSADKEYKAKIKLGTVTDTLDITGTVLKNRPVNIKTDFLKNTLNDFLGKQLQIPPMYSALKKDGVRLYDLARNGKIVERNPREINIKEIELISFDGTEFEIRVLCSKGTYIRSLAADIGERLKTGAVLTSLRRTKTAGFLVENSVPLDLLTSENIESYIINEEISVSHFPLAEISEKQSLRFQNGGELALERIKNYKNLSDGDIVRVKNKEDFIGLGTVDATMGVLKVKCLTKHSSDK